MKRKELLVFCLLALGAIALLTGCGSDKDVVATVGGYDITAEELQQFYKNVGYTSPTAQDEFDRKMDVLDSLVVTRLLIQAAYDKHIDQMEELARVVLANKDKFMLDALYKEHIGSKIDPTEEELRDFYNKRGERIRASHILLPTEDSAKAVLKKVQGGANFEQLAFECSIDPSAKRNRGDLGYFSWGDMVAPFQEAAFKMQPGEVSPPVKSNSGWHIIKLVDRMPNEQRGTFDQMKEQLRRQLVNTRQQEITMTFLDSIEQRYPIRIDTATCEFVMFKRENLYPPQILKTLPRNDFDVKQLDRNEKELVLASWDGGEMTLGEYLEQIKQVPPQMKPDFDDYDGLAQLVYRLKRPDILIIEAYREGLDNSDEFQDKLKLFKELNMADIMRTDSVPKLPAPDEGQIRQYYEDHPDEFTSPARIHVYEILLSDERKARQLAGSINSLQEFKETAMDLTERPAKREVYGNLEYIERQWYPEIFDLARKTAIGAIGGPVVTMGKYSIFYVVDKIEPQLKDFLEVKNDIKRRLAAQNDSTAFANWVEEAKANTSIRIHEDAVWSTIDKDAYNTTTTNTEAGG